MLKHMYPKIDARNEWWNTYEHWYVWNSVKIGKELRIQLHYVHGGWMEECEGLNERMGWDGSENTRANHSSWIFFVWFVLCSRVYLYTVSMLVCCCFVALGLNFYLAFLVWHCNVHIECSYLKAVCSLFLLSIRWLVCVLFFKIIANKRTFTLNCTNTHIQTSEFWNNWSKRSR